MTTEYIQLKKSNCKSCYKCIRNCPVKSIRFSGNQAQIIAQDCICCGECFVVCPQDAKFIKDDTEKARVLLCSGDPVIASVAPSFAANYPDVGIGEMERALKALGFAGAEETAIGATIVKKEYENILAKDRKNVLISSCCPTVNKLIQRYFHDVLPALARVVSPMRAHAKDIKRRIPNAKVVFIGPCISKKAEADESEGDVDCVLTFEELSGWFQEKNIQLEAVPSPREDSLTRIFPTSGGIIKSMDRSKASSYSYIAIDGHQNCLDALSDIAAGRLSHCFVEMSACRGSCTGGPVLSKKHHSPVRDYISVTKYAGSCDYPVEMPTEESIAKNFLALRSDGLAPSEPEIRDILRQMGKESSADELNCGSCGYNTCREKAVAIYQGKADLTMCTPFLRDKAETSMNTILKNTPNGILMLNDVLEVQQINPVALEILNIRNAFDVIGEQVVRILDPEDFMEVRRSGRSLHNKKVYLAEYDKYIEETIVYDRTFHIFFCMITDITEEEHLRESKETLNRQTIETADKVIEKQMRIVQEIASLLGETTAETKIALTKLKESLTDA